MSTVTVTDFRPSPCADFTLRIRFSRRPYGGYYVCRADNGRHLGWVVQDKQGWEAYVSSSAWRGDSIDDEGDILDHVAEHIVGDIAHAKRVGISDSRREVAYTLVSYLINNWATAVTGEESPHCTPWKR